jgi:hypothetical protein
MLPYRPPSPRPILRLPLTVQNRSLFPASYQPSSPESSGAIPTRHPRYVTAPRLSPFIASANSSTEQNRNISCMGCTREATGPFSRKLKSSVRCSHALRARQRRLQFPCLSFQRSRSQFPGRSSSQHSKPCLTKLTSPPSSYLPSMHLLSLCASFPRPHTDRPSPQLVNPSPFLVSYITLLCAPAVSHVPCCTMSFELHAWRGWSSFECSMAATSGVPLSICKIALFLYSLAWLTLR